MKFLSCWNGFQCSLLKFHKEKTSALVPFRSQGARTRISEAREHKNRYIFAAIRFPQNKRNDIVAFPFYTSPSQKGVPGKEILLTRQALTSSVWFFKNLISNSQRPDYCLRNREILWPTFNSLPDWLKILSNRFTALSFCAYKFWYLQSLYFGRKAEHREFVFILAFYNREVFTAIALPAALVFGLS